MGLFLDLRTWGALAATLIVGCTHANPSYDPDAVSGTDQGAVDSRVDQRLPDAGSDALADLGGDAGCEPGGTRACYTGPVGTANVGLCEEGSQRCEVGRWGACVGQVLPEQESCNGEDDDCNGAADDLLYQACYSGPPATMNVGLCREGAETCSAGTWGSCKSEVIPQVERCNTEDDDCDGQTDEGCDCITGKEQPCGDDEGECVKGSQLCDAVGQWGLCAGQIDPVSEVCDNKDNDCDGQTDEYLLRPCYSGPVGTAGVGLCAAGTESCSTGVWSVCTGQITPTDEVCDGFDNDCDGEPDGLSRPCYTGPPDTEGEGPCVGGTQTCSVGFWSLTCEGEVLPTDEQCNDIDDDCDGQIDALTRSCYTASAGCKKVGGGFKCEGVCQPGERMCFSGSWSSCSGQVGPSVEVCDGDDNDCNGQTDEGEITCGVGACEQTIPMCVNDGDNPDDCLPGEPAIEVCDGVDNSCNALTDVRFCYTANTGCTLSEGPPITYSCDGLCKPGFESCAASDWSGSCQDEIIPVPEICGDNEDNDCNGIADDGCS